MRLVIGVDLGGTKIAAGLVGDGAVLDRETAPTPAQEGPEAVLAALVDVARRLVARAPAGALITGCGVGSAGVVAPGTGVIVSATDSLPGWAGTRVRGRLEAELGMPVAVVNDVHAHALAESRQGAGAGLATVLVLAAGTGIGGALVIDGRVQTGRVGVAGHFGHVTSPDAADRPCTCGGAGHLEAVASGPAMCADYRARSGDDSVDDGREVVRRALEGDADAETSVVLAGTALGRAVGGFVNSLDPDAVVVAGGLADSGELWWSAVRAAFAAERLPVLADTPLIPAELGGDAAILGAAALVTDPTGRPASPRTKETR
ncbi:ROK family protein [Agromyces italicus]|uniref:ROK family protein n=1 Tax=Agromyces italicus TaxID=279572 RepID=UPI0003B32BE1|nr:ROK family protein [Agromyces italicus]